MIFKKTIVYGIFRISAFLFFKITCRSLARIFVPSIFQSYHDMHNTSSKVLWWKWKKDKLDAIQQESERLTLELCLMTMILNVDLLCRVCNTYNKKKEKENSFIYRFQVHLVMNLNYQQVEKLNVLMILFGMHVMENFI